MSPSPAVTLGSAQPGRIEPGHSGVVIGRYLGTVVVTVHGELGVTRAAHLGFVLADLIDGQGNLSLVVDLHDASATDDECATVFADAAARARRHGGVITLSAPPALVDGALRLRGLAHLVEAAPPPERPAEAAAPR